MSKLKDLQQLIAKYENLQNDIDSTRNKIVELTTELFGYKEINRANNAAKPAQYYIDKHGKDWLIGKKINIIGDYLNADGSVDENITKTESDEYVYKVMKIEKYESMIRLNSLYEDAYDGIYTCQPIRIVGDE